MYFACLLALLCKCYQYLAEWNWASSTDGMTHMCGKVYQFFLECCILRVDLFCQNPLSQACFITLFTYWTALQSWFPSWDHPLTASIWTTGSQYLWILHSSAPQCSHLGPDLAKQNLSASATLALWVVKDICRSGACVEWLMWLFTVNSLCVPWEKKKKVICISTLPGAPLSGKPRSILNPTSICEPQFLTHDCSPWTGELSRLLFWVKRRVQFLFSLLCCQHVILELLLDQTSTVFCLNLLLHISGWSGSLDLLQGRCILSLQLICVDARTDVYLPRYCWCRNTGVGGGELTACKTKEEQGSCPLWLGQD